MKSPKRRVGVKFDTEEEALIMKWKEASDVENGKSSRHICYVVRKDSYHHCELTIIMIPTALDER